MTESGRERLKRYGWLLAMASKCVGCSPFLPTTESIEKDSQKATDKERERMSERTCFREIELERDQVSERERERERERA